MRLRIYIVNNSEINPKQCIDIIETSGKEINFEINIMGERDCDDTDNIVPKSNLSGSSKEHRNKAKILNEDIDNKTLALPNLPNEEKELLEYEDITKELKPNIYI